MSIALAIFAKNPDLSPVKTRLAKDIGNTKAVAFYRLCLQCLHELVQELVTSSPLNITPYWALAEQKSLLLHEWQSFNCLWTGEGELGDRLHHIYSTLQTKHDSIIMIGSDSPALPQELLLDAIQRINSGADPVVIGPAADGGFYLFGGRINIPQNIWLDTSYSREYTLQRLITNLQVYDIKPALLPLHFDVDTKIDFIVLKSYLQSLHSLNSSQLQILQFISEFDLS